MTKATGIPKRIPAHSYTKTSLVSVVSLILKFDFSVVKFSAGKVFEGLGVSLVFSSLLNFFFFFFFGFFTFASSAFSLFYKAAMTGLGCSIVELGKASTN